MRTNRNLPSKSEEEKWQRRKQTIEKLQNPALVAERRERKNVRPKAKRSN